MGALQDLHRESVDEILEKRLQQRLKDEAGEDTPPPAPKPERKGRPEPSTLEKVSKNTMVRQVGRTVMRELTRGLLGVLGIRSRRR